MTAVSNILRLGILGFHMRERTSNVQRRQACTIHHEGVDLFEGGSLPDRLTLERQCALFTKQSRNGGTPFEVTVQKVTEEPRPVFEVFSIHEQPFREQVSSNGTQDFTGIYRWCSMVLTSPPCRDPEQG